MSRAVIEATSGLRYEVTFVTLTGEKKTYIAATLFGEAKAVVLATRKHHGSKSRSPDHILSVEIRALPGSNPLDADLVDRYEW